MERNNMENLQKDFLPFELSLKMKQLGFDKPCLAKYITSDLVVKGCYKDSHIIHALFEENEICEAHILVPTFSQAFRWFREKYDLKGHVEPVEYLDGTPDTYHWSIFNNCNSGNDQLTHEEAELACLVKLIDIVENK
jgi:hypothetical protein